jgi:methylamine dehydrogenase light chain
VHNPFEWLEDWIDQVTESGARKSAQLSGRRSVLAYLGRRMVGIALIPMLPFDRSGLARGSDSDSHGGERKEPTDEDCDYWRYCALSGMLCTCCGGTVTSCPAGTEISRVSWVGTCENSKEGRSYLVSYNDCCGKISCGRCHCSNHERERPGYDLGLHNSINWCMANDHNSYHCTVASLVGLAPEPAPKG